MTRIHFFHGARDRVDAAAAWLRQACEERKQVLVYAPDGETAERLDRLLWMQPATGFLPHCSADSALAGETPVLIARRLDAVGDLRQDQHLLNLADEIPPGFARFEILVEVVSGDEDVRTPARERYKFYRERGYEIQNTDMGRAAP
jgi:DNA polymerase-3 subunit chi